MLTQQPSQPQATGHAAPEPDRFRALCSELEEYAYLPELTAGPLHPTQLLTGNHEETLDESILAGLTLP